MFMHFLNTFFRGISTGSDERLRDYLRIEYKKDYRQDYHGVVNPRILIRDWQNR